MTTKINRQTLISLSFIICQCIVGMVLTSCQDKDYEREAMALSAPDASQITGALNGDDYTWSWPSQGGQMLWGGWGGPMGTARPRDPFPEARPAAPTLG